MSERHRFLDSSVPEPAEPLFEALGHSGSDHYVGLETFDNPGCAVVSYSSDEVMAACPITGQPDFYTCTVQLKSPPKCIESKSLKLWFQNLMKASLLSKGLFCESLAVHIRDTVGEALGLEEEEVNEVVTVQLVQKSRGGISITSVA